MAKLIIAILSNPFMKWGVDFIGLVKLVGRHIDWDEHLWVMLFAYHTTDKVNDGHIPFQLVYVLYPLMLTKYLIPTLTQEGNIINNSIQILTLVKNPFFSTNLFLITCHFRLNFRLHIFRYKNNNLGLPSKLNPLFFWWTFKSKFQLKGL